MQLLDDRLLQHVRVFRELREGPSRRFEIPLAPAFEPITMRGSDLVTTPLTAFRIVHIFQRSR